MITHCCGTDKLLLVGDTAKLVVPLSNGYHFIADHRKSVTIIL